MRNFVIRLFYYLGLDWLFYVLNHHSKRVITFHHVIPQELLPPSEGSCICFSDQRFEEILKVIAERYGFSNDLSDTSTCTLTFDDGYLNQYAVAGKILEAKKIPAILFLAAELENSTEALVVDRHIIWSQQVPMDVAEHYFGRSFLSREKLWTQAVRPMFACDGKNRGKESLRILNEVWPLSSAYAKYTEEFLRLRLCGISSAQLDKLKQRGWMICHHTRTHFPVSELDNGEAQKEITPPEEKRAKPFSFPYGDLGSVAKKDVAIAEKSGYPCAFANGVNFTSLTGQFFYPRFMFSTNNKYEIHFQLSGLKYFLKYHRLLPVLNAEQF